MAVHPYKDTLHQSQRRLQIFLGILGVSLPFVLAIGNYFIFQHPKFAPSISHYYYSSMSVYFTAVLASFGFFLLTYEGYKPTEGEKVSDRRLSMFGGLFALVATFIPTACCEFVDCNYGCEGPNAHTNEMLGVIHLLGAGLFLFIMGWMSIFKFTLGPSNFKHQREKKIVYRLSGIVVWACLLILGLEFFVFGFVTEHDVLILETVMLLFFGTSWLVKSRMVDGLMAWFWSKVKGKSIEAVMRE